MIGIPNISDILAEGKVFCLATVVVSARPDVPVGQKAIVWPDGRMEGGFGGTRFDETVRGLAMKALAAERGDTVEIGEGVHAFLDILSPQMKLLICGAGHIAMPLARFAREVGFGVTVLDDRPDFAHPLRFPGCEVIAEDYVVALRNMPLGPSSYVVVITRGHEHDSECLAEILLKATTYVGLIGSHRRIRFVLEGLGRKGIPGDRYEDVFTPIGIPIGSESPEEIALSIAAELVCVRRRGPLRARALRAASEDATASTGQQAKGVSFGCDPVSGPFIGFPLPSK
jgi:xanthine dehydrogenase accessory factor